MQWADVPNVGFSTASPNSLVRPIVSEGRFDYRRVDAAARRDRDGSLMDDLQRLVRTRQACHEVGWGACRILDTAEPRVLAVRYDWRGGTVLPVGKLDDRTLEVEVPIAGVERLRPLFGNRDDQDMRNAADPTGLDPYGFWWFRGRGERR